MTSNNKTPYEQGYEAFDLLQDGEPIYNPYEDHTDAWYEFDDGVADAKEDYWS